jgi:hypothetical protein
MLTFLAVAVVLLIVAIAVVARRTVRPRRDLDWHGAHDSAARDLHRSGRHDAGGPRGGDASRSRFRLMT